MKNRISIILIAATIFLFSACNPLTTSNTPPTPNNQKGDMQIEWKHFVGSQALALTTGQYLTPSDEKYTVTTFNYYISNIQLKKADGSVYVYPKDSSYFLIKSNKASTQISTLKGIPAGEYTDISFLIGVDSTKNYGGPETKTGVLDPSEGMFWLWNTGYIFWKLEGEYIDSTNTPKLFRYHISGGGWNSVNNVREVKMNFGTSKLTISPDTKAELHLKVDVDKVFKDMIINGNPNIMDFSKLSSVLADNFSTAFSFMTIH